MMRPSTSATSGGSRIIGAGLLPLARCKKMISDNDIDNKNDGRNSPGLNPMAQGAEAEDGGETAKNCSTYHLPLRSEMIAKGGEGLPSRQA